MKELKQLLALFNQNELNHLTVGNICIMRAAPLAQKTNTAKEAPVYEDYTIDQIDKEIEKALGKEV